MVSNWVLSVHLFLAPCLARASKFTTNCTLPAASPTFVAPANIRGTFDILWSGLFTIFICIWTVQHLNVPEPRDGRDPGWKGDMKWGWKKFARKFKWMAFTLLLPEILLGKATVEFLAVRESLKRIRLSSGYQVELTSAERANWTKSHGFYAEMGGFVLLPRGNEASLVWHVAIEDILKLRECGILSTLPTISADHINNMSTGDFFAKATAVVQVTWMVIQVIVRFVKGLPVTQLEVTACSFAVTTCLIYLLWWEKPQGVNRVTELPSSLDYNIGSRYSSRISVFELDFLLDPNSRLRKWFAKEGMANDSIAYGYYWEFGIGITLGGVALGAVQCAAWDLDFPTTFELYLWRYSSVVTAAILPVMAVVIFSMSVFRVAAPRVRKYVSMATWVIYILGRLAIIIETVRTIFFLPPGAFVSTWSSTIPHIA